MPQAFLAIEDRRFYQHEGIDRMAVLRALLANLRAGETVQGASTISQQLARNLFLTRRQTINRKLREMVLASRIERRLSKDEILELYLNRVYLGDQAYGVDAAARRFFGKTAQELNLAEAAMLAGLPKAPSRSAPTESLERATARQHVVLEAMVDVRLHHARPARRGARAAYPRGPRDPMSSAPWATPSIWRWRRRAPRLARKSPDLVIQTTLDRPLQEAAANSIRRRLGNRAFGRRPLQASYLAVDRQGAVRALVGGTDYSTSKLNRVTQANRQPGSAFKTFVYTAALEAGLDTEDVRYDEEIVIDGWRPRNYDEELSRRGNLAHGLRAFHQYGGGRSRQRNRPSPRGRRGGAGSASRTCPGAAQFVPPSIALGSIETTLVGHDFGASPPT